MLCVSHKYMFLNYSYRVLCASAAVIEALDGFSLGESCKDQAKSALISSSSCSFLFIDDAINYVD
jgi:hypothetical protein